MGAVPGAGAQAGSLLLNVPTQLQLPQRASFVGAAKSNDLAGLVFLFNNNAALWTTEYSPQANIPPAIIPGFSLTTTLPFNSPFLPSSPVTTQPPSAFGPAVPTLPGLNPTQGAVGQGALVGPNGGLAPLAGGVGTANGIQGIQGIAGVPTTGVGTGVGNATGLGGLTGNVTGATGTAVPLGGGLGGGVNSFNLGASGALGPTAALGATGATGISPGLAGLGQGAATVPAGIGTAATQFPGGGPFAIPGLTL
jgi:hypothetical protein